MTPEERAQAACRGHDVNLFFPEIGESGAAAKAICQRCPVTQQCAEEGQHHAGIWGGLSERQRRTTRRSQATRPAAPTTKDRLEAELRAETRWVRSGELADRLGLNHTTARQALTRMAAEGRVEHHRGGYWRAS